MEINIQQAFKECRDNGLVYKRKYDGKKVRVTEKIFAIDTNHFNNKIFVRLSYKNHSNDGGFNDLDDLYCYFDDSETDNVMQLKAGQTVTIEGICKESTACPFTLDKCSILAVNKRNNVKNITETQAQPKQSQSGNLIETKIEQLLKEHRENKVAAKRKYNVEKIRLSGFVSSIDEDSNKIYIKLGETKDVFNDGIRC